MKHGGARLWPTELKTFGLVKRLFLGSYKFATRIRLFGSETWRKMHSNCIVVANHVTGADSIILQIALKRRLFMLAARKWFSNRVVSFFMTFFCEIVPIAMNEGARTFMGIKRTLQLLKNNQSIGVFPSGHLEPEGWTGVVNDGAAWLALKTGKPIVPVYLKNLALGPSPGSRPWITAAWEGAGSVFNNIFNRKIEVYVGEAIYPREGVDRRKEIPRLNAEIRRSYEELLTQASVN